MNDRAGRIGLWATAIVCVVLWASGGAARAGDSFYGKVTAVRSADVVVMSYGRGEYVVRLFGVEAPREGAIAEQARAVVAKLVLGKSARFRLERRTPNGEMVGRLLADDATAGVRDVGLGLLRAGLVRRREGADGKYGELAAAEADARKAKRGLWAQTSPARGPN